MAAEIKNISITDVATVQQPSRHISYTVQGMFLVGTNMKARARTSCDLSSELRTQSAPAHSRKRLTPSINANANMVHQQAVQRLCCS